MSLPPAFARSRSRRPAVWLLVLLVVCQSALVSALTTRGPSHRHEAPPQVLVLEDVRRAVTPANARPTHVLTALGHFHGATAAERHYHPRTDGSVQLAEPRSAVGDDGDGAIGAAAAFVALLPAAYRWTAVTSPAVIARAAAWPAITDDPEPLERPPRQA